MCFLPCAIIVIKFHYTFLNSYALRTIVIGAIQTHVIVVSTLVFCFIKSQVAQGNRFVISKNSRYYYFDIVFYPRVPTRRYDLRLSRPCAYLGASQFDEIIMSSQCSLVESRVKHEAHKGASDQVCCRPSGNIDDKCRREPLRGNVYS